MDTTQSRVLRVIAMLLLGGALFSVPYYAYFQVMNWVVMGCALLIAIRGYMSESYWRIWVFLSIAVIFNPVAPLHLRADVWQALDIVAIIAFTISFFGNKKPIK